LESAARSAPRNPAILEEIAAAQMLGGDYSSALKNLEKIPNQHRTPQINAALAFVKSRVSAD
jgi:Flp pilus assembly protein TadD